MKRTLFPVAILTVLYLAALALWPEALNHNSEYQWPVLHHGIAKKIIPASFAILAIIVILVRLYQKLDWQNLSSRTRTSLAFLILLTSLGLQIIPMTVHRMGLLEFPLRIYLPDHTSYFTDAIQFQEKQLFEDFPKLVTQLHTHSRTHPPGAIQFFHSLIRVTQDLPGFVQWYNRTIPRSQEAAERFHLSFDEVAAGGLAAALIILMAAGTVIFCLWSGNLLQIENRAVWLGACLFLFTPTFSNKSPVLDQYSSFLFLFGAAYFLWGLKRKSLWPGLLCGFFLSSGLWWSYSFLAAPPLCLLLAAAWMKKNPSSRPFLYLGLFLIALIVMPLAAWISGADPAAIYKANLAGWYFNNTVSGRIHMWKWILFNPYEFFAWLGVPIFLFFALAVGREVKKAWLKQWDRIDPLIWAIVIFGIALDLSGRVCYESPRLAWFYAPLVCLVAAKGFTETQGSNRAWPLAIVLVLQAATVLVFRMLF